VISDAHIGAASRERELQLLDFLDATGSHAASLLVVGDLFDFWFEWRHSVPRHGLLVVAALGRLVRAGVPVVWLAGNHDCWGGSVLRDDLGITYLTGGWRGRIGGWDVEAHHGDGLRGDTDRGYRRLAAVLRHPWAIGAYRWLHPDLGTRLALGTSSASRLRQASDGGEGLRRVAAARLAEPDAPAMVIHGHSHVATLERLPGGGVYANCGAWWADPLYLTLDERRVCLSRWTGAFATDPVLETLTT
jgi:UDP-2,3-diacylglucosamine hydrolase